MPIVDHRGCTEEEAIHIHRDCIYMPLLSLWFLYFMVFVGTWMGRFSSKKVLIGGDARDYESVADTSIS